MRHTIPPVLLAADLRLLLEGTGLSLIEVEPFTDEAYSESCELVDAMLYLATLVPASSRP